jgi:1,2-diacylglycerol 3-alpha-glucosyltransferase
MSSLRVLFISDVYFPRVNGVSTSIRTFRSDLAGCGVESTLVAPQYVSMPAEEDYKVLRVPSAGVPGDPEDRRMRWGALSRALDAFQPDSIDLVHIHTPFIAHYAGVRLARAAGIPCIATYHTFFEEYLHHYVPILPRRMGRVLARAFTRSQCRDVNALVAPSDPMRDTLIQYGVETPIHVVPTGLPADRFRQGDGLRFRKLAGLQADRPLLLYVGRVAHEKNIGFLVHSFAQALKQVPNAAFVIAGEGPAQDGLRKMVDELGLRDSVRFVGYLDRNEALLDCYAAADVFVFASRTETQGLVLLEAMAQGAALVSTAELGTKSILTPGCGAVVVEENVDAFAAAAVQVLQNPALKQQLSQQSRAHAEKWSSHSTARRLADLYESVCVSYRRMAKLLHPDPATVGRERQSPL